jgi:hypothetical protein
MKVIEAIVGILAEVPGVGISWVITPCIVRRENEEVSRRHSSGCEGSQAWQ